MRIVLVTGKGGVGKTTVAAATAVRAAARGHRTLVTSTDPAHSLADVLDRPLGDRPTAVAPRLDAQQIDAHRRLEEHWREVRDYLVELFAWGGLSAVEAEELVLLPGLDEVFSLIDLASHARGGRYDLIVVDCAPTAETLRLLALPEALRFYVDRILGPTRAVTRIARPVVGHLTSVPLPTDGVFGAAERVHRRLGEVHRLLADRRRSSIRLVCNPERVVVAEALRTATSLALFGYGLDAVVCNRLLPETVTDPYLAGWRDAQAAQLARIRTDFAPTPVLTVPLLAGEPTGLDALAEVAELIYGELDETAVLHEGRGLEVERHADGEVRLRLPLPFATRDDLELHRRGGELHVRIGAVSRSVPLPAAVRRLEVAGAVLRDGVLEVRFRAPAEVVR